MATASVAAVGSVPAPMDPLAEADALERRAAVLRAAAVGGADTSGTEGRQGLTTDTRSGYICPAVLPLDHPIVKREAKASRPAAAGKEHGRALKAAEDIKVDMGVARQVVARSEADLTVKRVLLEAHRSAVQRKVVVRRAVRA